MRFYRDRDDKCDYLFIRLSRTHRLEAENKLLQQQNIYEAKRATEVQLLYQQIVSLRHEMKHHLALIGTLSKDRETELGIFISNSISSSVLKDNPLLSTTKNPNSFHGFGIKNIKRVVEKYGGS